MEQRFILIETAIEEAKQQLLEAGEILIRSIKTGKLYPVKKFNSKNHMKPTPAQIDKYYREKAGVFPSDAAKEKYKKTKPKAKKKKLPPKKKKVISFSRTISMNPTEMFKLSEEDTDMLIDDIDANFPNDIYGNVAVQKFNDHTVIANFTLPNGKKQTLYVGIEDTKSAGGTYAKLVGNTEDPKIIAFFPDASGKPMKRTYFDIGDLEIDLQEDHWVDEFSDGGDDNYSHGDRSDRDDESPPFSEPQTRQKVKSKKLDMNSLSDDAKKRMVDWQKKRVGKDRGVSYLRQMKTLYERTLKQKYDRGSTYYMGDIAYREEIFKDFSQDVSANSAWGMYVGETDQAIQKHREANKGPAQNEKTQALEEVHEHIDKTRQLISEELTNPFVFRQFVGDDYDLQSWKLSKLSNLVFGGDPKDDYRYKKQVTERPPTKRGIISRDNKPEEDWKKDATTFKKIMAEQQEVLKKMGFVNEDGTVTLVRSISVGAKSVPEYTSENKGIINADYEGSAADSWTLDYGVGHHWDADTGERILVKARVPLEKVLATSWGMPPQHVMAPLEHEVIINSKELAGVELYPDYEHMTSYAGDEDLPSEKELNKRTDKIMENEDQLDERRKKKDKKVKVNINNKRNIDWLRSGKKNKGSKKTNRRK